MVFLEEKKAERVSVAPEWFCRRQKAELVSAAPEWYSAKQNKPSRSCEANGCEANGCEASGGVDSLYLLQEEKSLDGKDYKGMSIV